MATKKTDLSIPDYVHPLGVRFRVELLPESEEEALLGATNVDRKLIQVAATQDSGRRWSTLYHEYIHGALGLVGIDDALNELEGIEECIVRTVETATEQFLLAHGATWLEALQSQKGE